MLAFLKRVLVLTFVFYCGLINAQRGVRIGYIDMNVILDNISEYKKSTKILDERIVQWKKEIELKSQKRSQGGNDYITFVDDLLNIKRGTKEYFAPENYDLLVERAIGLIDSGKMNYYKRVPLTNEARKALKKSKRKKNKNN